MRAWLSRLASPARQVRAAPVGVIVLEDEAEGSADGGADAGRAEAFAAGEPDADVVFSSWMGDGRLANGPVRSEVWLLTRADMSRASRWR